MKPAPFELEPPVKASPQEIIGVVSTLWKVLGWELGERYHHYMAVEKQQPNWLTHLWHQRKEDPRATGAYHVKHKPKLHDFTFVIREPEEFPDSPLWGCLPDSAGFTSKLRTVRLLRNKQIHSEWVADIATLEKCVKAVLDVAEPLDLPVKSACREIIARVNELKQGIILDTGDTADLEEALAHAKNTVKTLSSQVAELQGQMGHVEGKNDELRSQMLVMEERLNLEREKAESLQSAVASELSRERRDRRLADSVLLNPGEPWLDDDIPNSQQVYFLPNVMDFYDRSLNDLLSNRIGTVAFEAAERWQKIMPNGGLVQLDERGYAVGQVGGGWIFLGSIDGETRALGSEAGVSQIVTKPTTDELTTEPPNDDLQLLLDVWPEVLAEIRNRNKLIHDLMDSYCESFSLEDGQLSIFTLPSVSHYEDFNENDGYTIIHEAIAACGGPQVDGIGVEYIVEPG